MNAELLNAIISAGLHDELIRQEVVNYLKAETAKVKPEPEWKEVYRRQSETPRYLKVESYSGETVIEVVAHLIAYFNHWGVGMIRSFIGHPLYADYALQHSEHSRLVFDAFIALDYAVVVDTAIQDWQPIQKLFEERTHATEEQAQASERVE